MKFRRSVVRWDKNTKKGIIKYQLEEMIITCENEEHSGSMTVHFWIPGLVDRHVVFKEDPKKLMYLAADTQIAKTIKERIEAWYEFENFMNDEEKEQFDFILESERKEGRYIPENERDEKDKDIKAKLEKYYELRKDWKKRINNYKSFATVWEDVTKNKDGGELKVETLETEDGLIILAKYQLKEDRISQRLYSLQNDECFYKTMNMETEMNLMQAIEKHMREVKPERKERKHWDRYVHQRLNNYKEIVTEMLQDELKKNN